MKQESYQNNISKYSNEEHAIFHGDTLEILDDHIPDESIDLVFADPPYNIGKRFGNFLDRWESDDEYANWCQKWLEICIRKLRPNGSLYVMSSTQAIPYIDLFLRKKMTILSRIVWHYDSSGVQAKKYYGSLYEPILYAVKDPKNYTFNGDDIAVEAKTGAVRKLIDYRKSNPTPYNTKKIPGNVWIFPRVRYRMEEYEDHPSQKPEILLERILLASTNKGDIVLDPFAGTFTTCAVAKRLGRLSIGIEINFDYIKTGIRRLGIAQEINNEILSKPDKSFGQRRNNNHAKGNL